MLAVIIGVGGYVVGKNLPSLLDIILLKQDRVSAGARYAVATLTRYTIVFIATLLVLETLGASWSQMGWAAAALGVGIGFGLQEIIANFVSGLILLFEQPVRVGDVVTIGDASGTVSRIRMRATTIRDWDNKELIVPNKELVTGRLLNWSLSDAMIRVTLTVGVAYGSDVDKAMALLREAADENKNVVDEPEPRVIFDSFGDSSLTLNLRAYIADLEGRPAEADVVVLLLVDVEYYAGGELRIGHLVESEVNLRAHSVGYLHQVLRDVAVGDLPLEAVVTLALHVGLAGGAIGIRRPDQQPVAEQRHAHS